MDEKVFFSSVLFEMIKSSSLYRKLSGLKFSETEEDSGKENQKKLNMKQKMLYLLQTLR